MAKRFPRGILASCCIPWDENNRFMEDVFREQVRIITAETNLVYIMGTAGEGYSVSDAQFQSIARAFADETRKSEATAMVGLISLSLATIQERIDLCRDLGITNFQISLPSWEAVNDAELYRFFDRICGKNLDCSFLHYNLSRAKRLVSPAEYAEIERRHPNIVATKNAGDSMLYIAKLMAATSEIQHFITDIGYLYAASIGECGLLIAIASCNWETARDYFESARSRASGGSGDFERALGMQQQIVGIHTELMNLVLPHGHIDGAFDKLYAKLHQPEFPLRLYPPYEGSNDTLFESFKEVLRSRFPDWYPDSGRKD